MKDEELGMKNEESGAGAPSVSSFFILHSAFPVAPLVVLLGNLLGLVWMGGGTLFFLLRFSSVFYQANQWSIDKLIRKLF
jgi:hypothetical protein